jgi:hypothetical protein
MGYKENKKSKIASYENNRNKLLLVMVAVKAHKLNYNMNEKEVIKIVAEYKKK